MLFNLIDELPVNCLTHPDGTVKPYLPSNFISVPAFTLLPEASQLALLDGVGESDISRKPEALFRFLVNLSSVYCQRAGAAGQRECHRVLTMN